MNSIADEKYKQTDSSDFNIKSKLSPSKVDNEKNLNKQINSENINNCNIQNFIHKCNINIFSCRMKMKLKQIFKNFTNHEWNEIFNDAAGGFYENFVNYMYHPVDGASLGVGRMLFGLMMLLDIPEERMGADLDYRWGDPRECRYPLFGYLKPLNLPRMGLAYGIMWLGELKYFVLFNHVLIYNVGLIILF